MTIATFVSDIAIADWSDADVSLNLLSKSNRMSSNMKVCQFAFTGWGCSVNFNLQAVKESLESKTIKIPDVASVEELDAWLMGLKF